MAKKKKIKEPYCEDNIHHLLFGEEECSAPGLSLQECSVQELNEAIWDWQIIADIELARLRDCYDEDAAYNLKQARKHIQMLKLQKRKELAKAV